MKETALTGVLPIAEASASAAEQHSKRRWKAVFRSGAALGGARLLTMGCSLLQVPIALHYLGSEAFGLWVAITGTVALLTFADLGIGLGIQNKVAEAYGNDDLPKVRRVFTTGFTLLLGIGLILALLAVPVCYLFPWANILKVANPQLRMELPGALAIVVLAMSLGIPLGGIARLGIGLQLGWMNGLWAAVGSLLALGLIALASTLHVSFTQFVLFAIVPPLVVNLGLFVTLYKSHGWRITEFEPDWSLRRPLLSQGTLFVIPQINSLILLTAPQVIISMIAGPMAVTPYNLVQRISNVITQTVAMLASSLWPAFAEAAARRDWKWIDSAYHNARKWAGLAALVPCLIFAIFGQKIITIWSSAKSLPSWGLVVLMSLLTWAMAYGQPGLSLLGGCNRLAGISYYATATSITFLLLVSPFMKWYGVEGAAFALLLSYVAFTLIGSLVEIHQWLRARKRIPA